MTDEILARLQALKTAHWEAAQEIHKTIFHDKAGTEQLREIQRGLDKIYPIVLDFPPKSTTKGGKWCGKLNPDPEV